MLTEAVRQNPSDTTARRYLSHALVREDPRAAVAQFDALRSAGPLPPDDERSYRHALSLAATGSLVEASAIDKALRVVQEDPAMSRRAINCPRYMPRLVCFPEQLITARPV